MKELIKNDGSFDYPINDATMKVKTREKVVIVTSDGSLGYSGGMVLDEAIYIVKDASVDYKRRK